MSLWSEIEKLFHLDRVEWDEPEAKITDNFTVKEALWLPKWNRMANHDDGLTDGAKKNLITLFKKIEVVRSYLSDSPIIVLNAFRPSEYNYLIGGADNSTHMYGMAVDWYIAGVDCNELRNQLVPMLDEWDMRCEDKIGNWIHLDIGDYRYSRFFKP